MYTDEEKLKLGKRAAEMGVTKTMRYFQKQFSDRPLKESTVRTWANTYKRELALRGPTAMCMEPDGHSPIKMSKPRGPPLLLGKELDANVQEYVKCLRENGAVINSAIVMAGATGIVKSYDSNLLKENGGHIECNKSWAKSFLKHMGYVKRKATTKAKVNVTEFESIKSQFVFDIQAIVELEEIPPELIINWDHTGIHYVPVGNWTQAKKGSTRVEVAGSEDKRQITAVFAGTKSGQFLPPQIIYAGKTKKCLPSGVEFPENWHVTFTENHWANEKTTEDYLKFILLPYVVQTRKDLSLPDDYPALLIFDRFKGQCTENILSLLNNNHLRISIVPANCTDRLQPLDISVNKAVKEFLRRKFQHWYSEEVRRQIEGARGANSTAVKVDLSMSVVKPIGAQWLIDLVEYMHVNPNIIINGFNDII